MNLYRHNRPLAIAIGCSLLAHACLLAIRFAAPDAFRFKPTDPGLEVILVNAKHARAPVKADALAQANLDGGGNADAGRAESPLPDLHEYRNGDSLKDTQRRIAEMEERQQNLLTQVTRSNRAAAPMSQQNKPDTNPDGAENTENARAFARSVAAITQRISDENKRPRKTFISPSTMAAGYAMYYKAMQKRVEDVGTLTFPQQNGRKLYGELILSIPIYQDGTIYEKAGGPQVEHSSGNAALDRAALSIVRRAAPFGRFPQNMRSSDRDELWTVIVGFHFERDAKLRTDLRVESK